MERVRPGLNELSLRDASALLSPQVEALQRIQVARVFDVYKMLDVLQELRCSVSQQVGLWLSCCDLCKDPPSPSGGLILGSQGAARMSPNVQDGADCSADIRISRLLQDSNLFILPRAAGDHTSCAGTSFTGATLRVLPSHFALCFAPQVLSSSGPVKVLVVDSVSAVICPLLGGRQAEGE